METLKSWLGVQQQDGGLQIQDSDSDKPQSDIKSGVLKQIPVSDMGKKSSPWVSFRDNAPKIFLAAPPSIPDNAKPKSTKTPASPSEASVQPSEATPPLKNCLSCKVIGTSTLTGTMVYVLYLLRRHRHDYTGWRRVAYMGQGIFLSTTLGIFAVSILLDVGLFRPRKQQETILDQVKDDYNNLASQLSLLFSSRGPGK